MDSHEVWAFIRYAPAYQDIFQAIKARRDSLASEYDAGTISISDLKSTWAYYINKESTQLANEVETNNAESQERGREVSQALLDATAAYYNQRAASDAATVAEMQENLLPKTTYTHCERNSLFGGVDCTATTH